MGDPAERRATYYDLLRVPAIRIAEILHGVLVTQPRPGAPHTRAASRLGGALDGPFDRGKGGPGGWVILDEPELHLHGGHVIVPDLAGWRRERMPRLPMEAAAFDLAPDWVCEIPSPSTAATDRVEKVPIYAAEEATHLWWVDPVLRLLEVHRLDGETYRTIAAWRDSPVVRAEPFDAIDLELGALWET
jgi:Uma2 family endonuclease